MLSKRIFQLLLVSLGASQLAQGRFAAQQPEWRALGKRQFAIDVPLLGITIGATGDATTTAPPETTTAAPTTSTTARPPTSTSSAQRTSSTSAPPPQSTTGGGSSPQTTSSASASQPSVQTTTIIITTTNADGSTTTISSVSTTIPSAAPSNGGGSTGISKQTTNTIIGVVVGVGGAIFLCALGLLAWRIWGRKKNQDDNDELIGYGGHAAGTPYGPTEKSDASGSTSGRTPFQSTLESYHSPTHVNASSNF